MDQLSLEPYAARIRWHFSDAQPLSYWKTLCATFLDDVAFACMARPPAVIGHIKGLALLPGGGFLRGSKVSTRHAADVEISGASAVSCRELEIALNVLVYGLPAFEAERVVGETGRAIAMHAGATFEVIAEGHTHHHD